MSFFGGGGGSDSPGNFVMPNEGSRGLQKFMKSWRAQQKSKQGMESTILTDLGGSEDKGTILGDLWLTTK